MSNLLYVTSSLFGAQSKSDRIGREFVQAFYEAHPGTRIVTRDLNADPVPHLTGDALGAPENAESPAQEKALVRVETLISELEAADTIVIAAPMYNFSIPSVLKAWIDHIARAGRTFRYTEKGPVGLLTGKKVFIVTARGGFYAGDGAMKNYDFHEPYLRTVLGFLGLDTISFIYVEGQALGSEIAESGLKRARDAIGNHLPAALAA
jgi:FMN-dependent NADH-azoreductase